MNPVCEVNMLNEQVMTCLRRLREIKTFHPEARVDVANNPGSILNAYREGDLHFDKAVEMLNSCNGSESQRLTEGEMKALGHLKDFWNAYLELPDANGSEIIDSVHAIQSTIALRVAKRADPEVWL